MKFYLYIILTISLVVLSVAFAGSLSTSTNYNLSTEITSGGGNRSTSTYTFSEVAIGQPLINISTGVSLQTLLGIPLYYSDTSKIYYCRDIKSSGTFELSNSLSGTQSNSICINILSNNVVIDCKGYNLNGTSTPNGYGIWIYSKNNVTIKGCNITGYGVGIYSSSSNNTYITNNSVFENNLYDVYFYPLIDANCNNTITNTNGSGGRPIKYFNTSTTLSNEADSEIILCNADGSNLTNVTIDGSATKQNNALFMFKTDNVNLTNVTSSNNYYGFYFDTSTRNIFSNTISNNNSVYGIFLYSSTGNVFSNITSNNNTNGVYINAQSNNTTISDSTLQENNNYDFYITTISDGDCSNTITNTNGSGGRPIKYFNTSTTLSNEADSEIILCNADGSNLTNVTIDGSATKQNNALLMSNTDNSNFTSINSSNNYYGIYVVSGNGNNFTNCITASNGMWDVNSITGNRFINHTVAGSGFAYPTTVNFTPGGYNYIKGVTNPPADPSTYASIPKYVNASSFGTSWIALNISYTDSDVPVLTNESALNISRYGNSSWFYTWETNASKFANNFGVNTAANYVYANITNFTTALGDIFAPMGAYTCNPPASGDWTIDASSAVVCANRTITVTGNLYILGNLTLYNVTLHMNSSSGGGGHIRIINVTGKMLVYDNDNNPATTNDASNITNGDEAAAVYYWWVWPGAKFEVKNSLIDKAGNLPIGGAPACEYPAVDQMYCGLTIMTNSSNITGNSISGSYHGIIIQNNSYFNNVSFNNVTGLTRKGIYVYNSSNNTISSNTVNSNYDGILLIASKYTSIINNTANSNSASGISLNTQSNNNTVTNNTANNNQNGIAYYALSNYNSIINNTVDSNSENGLYSWNSSFNSIINNTVNNSNYGMSFDISSTNNTATSNVIKNSLVVGSSLWKSSSGNNLTSNVYSNSGLYGIDLNVSADSNTLLNNTIYNSTVYDLVISGSTNNRITNLTIAGSTNATYPTMLSFSYYGNISIKGVTSIPGSTPGDYGPVYKYVNATNQSANSWLYLNISYTLSDLFVNESTLIMARYNNSWETDTSKFAAAGSYGVNTVNDYVYANITNFGSIFTPLGKFGVIYNCMNITKNGTYVINNSVSGNLVNGRCMDIQTDNVTIDCAGSTISNYDQYTWANGLIETYGFYINGKTNITLKNCNINNFTYGVYISGSSKINVTHNIISDNRYFDIYFSASSDGQCDNSISDTNGSGSRAIKYYNSSTTLSNQNLGELILCNADSSSFNNITINGSTIRDNNAMLIYRTDNSNFTNVNSAYNYYGIYMTASQNNTIANSTLQENNYFDIYMTASSDAECRHSIYNITSAGGRVIKYYNSSTTLSNEELSELILCNAGSSTISNVTINGSASRYNNAIMILRTNDTTITNLSANYNAFGAYINQASNDRILNSTFDHSGGYGLYLTGVSNFVLNNSNITYSGTGSYYYYDSIFASGGTNNVTIENSRIEWGGPLDQYPADPNGNGCEFDNGCGVAIDGDFANSIIKGNVIQQHGYGGLFLGSNNLIENNYLGYNNRMGTNGGQDLIPCCNNVYRNNTIETNGRCLEGGGFATFDSNRFNSCGGGQWYVGGTMTFINNNFSITMIASYGASTNFNYTGNRFNGGLQVYSLSNSYINNNIFGSNLVSRSATIWNNNTINNNSFTSGSISIKSSNSRITNNNLASGSITITNSSTNNTVSDNIISGVGRISLLSSSTNNTVSDNTISGSSTYGIEISSSNNNTIQNNSATGKVYGVYSSASSNNTLDANLLNGNTYGVYLDSSSLNNTIENSLLNNNGNTGIFITGSSNNNTFDNNTVRLNNPYGIFITGSSNNIFIDSTVENNNRWDFYSNASSKNTVLNLDMGILMLNFTGVDFSLRNASSPAADPSGYKNIGKYANATNNSANSWLLLNISTKEAYLVLNASTLAMARWNSVSGWTTNIASFASSYGNDVNNEITWANITGFGSIFAPLGSDSTTSIDRCTNITKSGYYFLNTSISNSAAACCMNITANSVTVDGGGFTIDGTNVSTGICASNVSHIAFKNATLQEWIFGVNLTNVTQASITNNTIVHNIDQGISYGTGTSGVNISGNNISYNTAYGILAYTTSNSTITNNTIKYNYPQSLTIGNGIYAKDTTNTVIANNSIGFNFYENVYLLRCANNTIDNNTLTSNSVDYGDSIYLQSSSNNTLSNNIDTSGQFQRFLYIATNSDNNTIVNNTGTLGYGGIYVISSSFNTVKNNTITNGAVGVYLETSGNSTVDDNFLRQNAGYAYGVDIKDSSNCTIKNNDASYNLGGVGNGLYVSGTSNNNIYINNIFNNSNNGMFFSNPSTSGNLIANNTLTSNTGTSSVGYGMYFVSGLYHTVIINNTITSTSGSSGSYAVYITSGGNNNTILNNNISLNNGYGFYSANNGLNNSLISKNNFVKNYYVGLFLGSNSQNNTLTNNTASNTTNGNGMTIYGNNNTISDTTANNNNNYGIAIQSGTNTTVSNVTANNNIIGIYLSSHSNDTISESTLYNNTQYGVWGSDSRYNNITDNTIQENNNFDVYFNVTSSTDCMNFIDNNNGSGSRAIKYFNSSATLSDETDSEIILCNAGSSTLTNVTVDGSDIYKNNALLIFFTNVTNLTSITSSNNYYGAFIINSYNDTFSDIITNNNAKAGFVLNKSSYNNISSLTTNYNNGAGLMLNASSYNSLSDITTNNNTNYGIYAYTYSIGVASSNNTFLNIIANNNSNYGMYIYGNNNTFKNIIAGNNTNYGMYIFTSDNGTVTNGTFNADNYGIYLDSSNRNNLTNITANSKNTGVVLYSSTRNNLINITANNNSNDGIAIDYYSHNNTVSTALVNNNSIGIYVGRNPQSSLSNNITSITANYNTLYGINLDTGCTNNTMSNSVANNNGNYGVYLYIGTDSNRIDNITANTNGQGGFWLRSNNHCVVNNSVANNTISGSGFIIGGTNSNMTFTNNIANNNSLYGFSINVQSSVFTNNTANNNSYGFYITPSNGISSTNLTYNTANNNKNSGFQITSTSSSNVNVSGNVAINNTDGFVIDVSTSRFDNNTAINNSHTGLAFSGAETHNITNNIVDSNQYAGMTFDIGFSKIINNNVRNSPYGMIFTASGSNSVTNTTIFNSTIWDIQIWDSPGAIYTNLTLNDTVIDVTSGGRINIKDTDGIGRPDIRGVSNISYYLNITNSSIGSWAFVNISYKDSDLPSRSTDNSTLKIWKYSLGQWFNETYVGTPDSVNQTNKYVYANITNFGSIYAPMVSTIINTTFCRNLTQDNTIYLLNQSISGNQSNGICIDTQADNVTLDCNGYNITGNVSATTYGVNAKGRINFTMKNCIIVNYTFGAYINNSNASSFTSNVANNNSYGFSLLSSNNNNATNDTATNNTIWDVQVWDSTGNAFTNFTLNDTHTNFTLSGRINMKDTDGTGLTDLAGYSNISYYLNITNSSVGSWIFLNISYKDADIPANMTNSTIAIWKYSSGQWWNRNYVGTPNSINEQSKVVYANITNFGSIYAPIGYTRGVVACMNLTSQNSIYKLFSNVTGNQSNGICIDVQADNITLDCTDTYDNMYNITGNNSATTYGVNAKGRVNFTMKNCMISNYTYGIYLNASNNSVVSNNTIYGTNSWDIYTLNTLNDTFKNQLLSGTLTSYPVTINFTSSSNVSLKGVAFPPATEPDNYEGVGKFVNITNISANAWIALNISYLDSDLKPRINESTLNMTKYNGTIWNTTISLFGNNYGVDTVRNVVYANITGFGSIFAPLGLVVNTAPIINSLVFNSTTGYNLTSDNLTAYTSAVDAENDNVSVIYNWYKNGQSTTLLNMPFNTRNSTATKDYSGNGNNGTVKGNLVWWASGKIGGAYLFGGSSSYLNLTNNINFSGNTTTEAWIYMTGITQSMRVVSKSFVCWNQTAQAPGRRWESYGFGVNGSGNLEYYMGQTSDCTTGQSNNDYLTTAPLNTGQWYYVAVVVTNNNNNATRTVKLYVNGSLASSTLSSSLATYPSETNMDTRIGSVHVNNTTRDYFNVFNGTIDEVRIYNYSLSSEQIYQHWLESKDSYSNSSTIVSQELIGKDKWSVLATPSDGLLDGPTNSSGNITIASPVISCMNLTSANSIYVLNQSIAGNQSNGRCVDIQAANITLNCVNYPINGSYPDNTYGIYTNSSNITIKNCFVQNYTYGIYLNASNNSSVKDNIGYNNTNSGIAVYNGSNNNISNNTLYTNVKGLYLESRANNNTITNNTAYNNTWDVYVSNVTGNVFVNQTIAGNSITAYPTRVNITANNVSLRGVTTAPVDPWNYRNITKYVNATNLSTDTWLAINISYLDADPIDETKLNITRYNNSWNFVTGTFANNYGVDTTNNVVYANITGFGSIFVPLENRNVLQTSTALLNNGLPISLAACANTAVVCNGTIDDANGYADINSVSAVLYHSTSTPQSPDDNNTHYTNSSCVLSSGYATTKKDYTCAFPMNYYADNGTWTCNVTAYDYYNNTVFANDSRSLGVLKALNVYEDYVNYGILSIGDTSSPDRNITLQNCGNVLVSIYLSGTDLSCTQIGSITVSWQRYNISAYGAGYGNMNNLTATSTYSGLQVLDTITNANSTNKTYWAIQIPPGVKGLCSGTITAIAQ